MRLTTDFFVFRFVVHYCFRPIPQIRFSFERPLKSTLGLGFLYGFNLPLFQTWPHVPLKYIYSYICFGPSLGNASGGGLLRDSKGQWIKGFYCNIGPYSETPKGSGSKVFAVTLGCP